MNCGQGMHNTHTRARTHTTMKNISAREREVKCMCISENKLPTGDTRSLFRCVIYIVIIFDKYCIILAVDMVCILQ